MPRQNLTDLGLVPALVEYNEVPAFRVSTWIDGQPEKWRVTPLQVNVLSEDGSGGGFYIVQALQVLPDGNVVPCHMDVSYPERINDYAYFLKCDRLVYGYTRDYPGKIIPALAFDCFGQYDIFYVKTAPQIGIDVLTRGLAHSVRKRNIARDLGYILRDEKRYREAAEMFEMVVAEEVSSYFIFGELAGLYKKLGDGVQEAKYRALYTHGSQGGA